MRILVVEDEKDLRNIIKKRLVREHYSVDVCGDGEEALDYMEMTSMMEFFSTSCFLGRMVLQF